MSAINSINTAPQKEVVPWTKKQIIAQNVVGSAILTPVSMACYEIFCTYHDTPNMKFKDICVRIADESKKGISKIFNKVGLTKLSEKYSKIGRKPALAIELGLHFLTLLGGISLIRTLSKKDE